MQGDRRPDPVPRCALGVVCFHPVFMNFMLSRGCQNAEAAHIGNLQTAGERCESSCPAAIASSRRACSAGNRQRCCVAGCTGTVCGIKVSDALSEFLNFPDLNLLMCGLLADCGNAAYTDGATGGEVRKPKRLT